MVQNIIYTAASRLERAGEDQLYRQPPANEEAEQALLGAILVNNRAYDRVADFLRAEHFASRVHGRIFAMIGKALDAGQNASPILLKPLFDQDPDLKTLGGGAYLAQLAASVVTIINTEEYGRTIYDLFLRRELIGLGEDLVNDAYKPDIEDTAERQIERVEEKLYNLAETGEANRDFVSFNKALSDAVERAQAAKNRNSHVSGLTTGLIDLDRKLGGLQKSDLIILAGRPSMGKTALATNIAFSAAKAFLRTQGQEGGHVAFFSLEMSAEQLATRILSEQCEVPSEKIRRGEVHGDDFDRFIRASQELTRVPMFIDDTPALSIDALRTRARRLKRKNGRLDLIVVDYLQLVTGSGTRSEQNRVLEISEITRGLKALAKQLDVPVMALAQLSRAVEQREDKRPQLSDLRESGSIEQDADVVMFVYREQYYLERAEPTQRAEETTEKFNDRHERWLQRCNEVMNLADAIVAKQRHGPIGDVKLHFEGQFTKFSDLQRG
jgi:replicative DNA helicase